MSLRVFFVTF